LPELIHPFPDLGNIIGVNTAAAVCSDSDLIDIVGNVSCKFQKVFQVILVELNDVSLKDHLPEKVTTGLHTTCVELAVERFVFLVTEPDLNTVFSLCFTFQNLCFLSLFLFRGLRGGSPLTSGALVDSNL